MAQSVSNNAGKNLIKIDVSSDTLCPGCFVGKRNLDKAIALSKEEQYEFEVRWRPFFLNPSTPKEGINKQEFYRKKFGPQSEQVAAWMFLGVLALNITCLDSRNTTNFSWAGEILWIAGKQGLDKQHNVEEIFLGLFTQPGKIHRRPIKWVQLANFDITTTNMFSLNARTFLWHLPIRLGWKEQHSFLKTQIMDSTRFIEIRNDFSSCRRDGIEDEIYLSFKFEDGYLKR